MYRGKRGPEILGQHLEPRSVGVLQDEGVAHLAAQLLHPLTLPDFPQIRGEVEQQGLEEEDHKDPLIVAKVHPLGDAPGLGANALGNGYHPGVLLVIGHQSPQAGQVEGLGGGMGIGGYVPSAATVGIHIRGQDIGAHGPAVRLHVLYVLLGADAEDRLSEILLGRQQEGASQEYDDGALGVEGENWVVDPHCLQAEVLG